MNTLFFSSTEKCACGKIHRSTLEDYVIGKGVISTLPDYVKKYNAQKAFLIADVNTYPIAGDKIRELLGASGIECVGYTFNEKQLEPDEKALARWSCTTIQAVIS